MFLWIKVWLVACPSNFSTVLRSCCTKHGLHLNKHAHSYLHLKYQGKIKHYFFTLMFQWISNQSLNCSLTHRLHLKYCFCRFLEDLFDNSSLCLIYFASLIIKHSAAIIVHFCSLALFPTMCCRLIPKNESTLQNKRRKTFSRLYLDLNVHVDLYDASFE